MNRLCYLRSILNAKKLAQLGAALWSKIGNRVDIGDLTWAIALLGPGGDRLLLEGLQESGALDRDGKLSSFHLARCLETLAGGDPLRSGDVTVVWTLPLRHPDFYVLGHTYREAVISVVESARREIIMVSPFLQETGIDLLMEPLLRALWRGVKVTILTHGVEDVASSQSQALEKLRREAKYHNKRLSIYVAKPGLGYLLHAKILVADQDSFVMGSANITGQGLGGHFEAGIIGREPQAEQVREILQRTINSGMVTLILGAGDMGD